MMYPYGTLAQDVQPVSYPDFDCLDSVVLTSETKRILRVFALECVGKVISTIKEKDSEYCPSLKIEELLKIINDELDFQEPIDLDRFNEIAHKAFESFGPLATSTQHPEYHLLMAIRTCAISNVLDASNRTAYNSRNAISRVNRDKDPSVLKFWLWQQQKQRLEQLLGMI